jgi:Alginate lyase
MRVLVWLMLVTSAAGVHGQAFAVFSPEAVRQIAAQKDSAVGLKFVHDANGELKDDPHPMERVHTEGTLAHQGIRDESQTAERDWDKMLNFAMAYRLTGDPRFLAAADRFLGSWMSVYKASFNPIDETNLDKVMMTFDLTRGQLKPATEAATLAWLHDTAEGYTSWMEQRGDKDIANWSSHRVKLAVLAAYELGDPKLQARAAKVFRDHLAKNMNKDGSVEDFYKRDALHYVVYDLEPMETAALAAQAHGEHWFDADEKGKTLAHGVDWLVPFATGQKKHMEFVHSTVKFDADRDKAGEKGYSGQWDPSASVNTLALAALMDPRFEAILTQVEASTGHSRTDWVLMYSATHSAPK